MTRTLYHRIAPLFRSISSLYRNPHSLSIPTRLLILAATLLAAASCHPRSRIPGRIPAPPSYSSPLAWFSRDTAATHPADIFYVYPTVTLRSFTENGNSFFADIAIDSVRKEAHENQLFNKLLYQDGNFFAPYYRQLILDSYSQNESILRSCAAVAAQDIKNAFAHYMAHDNQNRPFFLVGHSQGSQMLLELLKNGMTDQQFSRLVAAYCMGIAVTQEELDQYPHRLIPARDSADTGCLIVINSVTKPESVSRFTSRGVVGINPLTWTTDSLPANKTQHRGMALPNAAFDGVIVTPQLTGGYLHRHVMVCTDLKDDFVYVPEFAHIFPVGNLHLADSWLYAADIVHNMRVRLNAKMKTPPAQ